MNSGAPSPCFKSALQQYLKHHSEFSGQWIEDWYHRRLFADRFRSASFLFRPRRVVFNRRGFFIWNPERRKEERMVGFARLLLTETI